MNVMFRIVHDVARALGSDYDVEILKPITIMKKPRPAGPR